MQSASTASLKQNKPDHHGNSPEIVSGAGVGVAAARAVSVMQQGLSACWRQTALAA